MVEPRASHTATLLADETVLVSGGWDSGGLLASAETFDPGSQGWTATPPMTEPRKDHGATVLRDGTVLVTGSRGLASVERYDPGGRSWTPDQSMGEARDSHTATLLSDGSMLVVGGTGHDPRFGYFVLASTELHGPEN
jgi:hypothetical protein